jgi:hypothetical protein
MDLLFEITIRRPGAETPLCQSVHNAGRPMAWTTHPVSGPILASDWDWDTRCYGYEIVPITTLEHRARVEAMLAGEDIIFGEGR